MRQIFLQASNRAMRVHHTPARGVGAFRAHQGAQRLVPRATQEPPADDTPTVNLEELDGSSSAAFYSSLAERGPDTLNVIICYTTKCLPCKMTKPIMKEWSDELTAQGKDVRFWQFALSLPNKDTALALGVNSSPRFLAIRGDGNVLCHLRGKAAVDDFRQFVFANC